MGIQERKLREKEALRQRILEAARDIYLREGPDALSIRKVARAIEYSPGTIYLHYRDKDDLLLELHRDAFRRKGGLFGPLMSITDPVARLEAMGRAYIHHALENAADFHLMFVDECPISRMVETGEEWTNGDTVMDMLRNTIQQGIDQGSMRPDIVPETMTVILWSLVHGCATLLTGTRLSMVVDDLTPQQIQDNLFDQMHRILSNG